MMSTPSAYSDRVRRARRAAFWLFISGALLASSTPLFAALVHAYLHWFWPQGVVGVVLLVASAAVFFASGRMEQSEIAIRAQRSDHGDEIDS